MSKRRPWYPWYPSDYANDTQFLSDSADLLYRRLLDILWINNGSVPFLRVFLAKNARFSREKFTRYWPEIEAYFSIEKTGKTHTLTHDRISTELAQITEKSEKARDAARRRWDADAYADADADASENGAENGMRTHMPPTPTPTPTTTNTDNLGNLDSGGGENSKSGQCPYQQIFDLYTEILVPPLPEIVKPDAKTRRGYIRQRWMQDMPDLKNWRNFFDYVRDSDFLCGRSQATAGRPPFIADLEWLCRPTNFVKIAQGNYHRR